MSRIRLIESFNILPEDLNYLKWPDVNFEQRNETFERRKKAVQLYIDNECTIREIKELTGIQRKELGTFVRKCLEKDEHNRMWGFRALIPFKRIDEKYDRIADTEGFNLNSSLNGAFNQLLERYPSLAELINDYILNRKRRGAIDRIIRIKDLRVKFLKLCRALGIQLNQYPFNTKDMVNRSLRRYVNKLIDSNIELASTRYGEEAKRKINRFDGDSSTKEKVVRPFESVQIDGHKIDVHLTVKFTNAYGDEVTEVIRRIWLIIIMDEGTKAVLSHHLCINSEYSKVDLLHAIKKAIVPWKPMIFTIPGLAYPTKPCFPSAAIDEAKWALWDELKCDNALANLSNIVEDRLTKIVNCSINPGQAQFPEGRPIIERFFGLLEDNYIHRLGMTTGSNTNDPRRSKDSEKIAKKYEFKAEELEQLIEVAIASYNTEIHSSLGISPLEAMEQRIKFRDMIPRQLAESDRNEDSFFTYQVTRIVRGSKESGKRPFINFEGEKYSSTILSRSFSLVGEKLILDVNIEDICVIKAYLPDGEEFDYFKVKGPWSKQPHSLRTRQIVNKLVREGRLKFDDMLPPVEAVGIYLEEKATTRKNDRNELAALQRYNNKYIDKVDSELNTLNVNVNEEPISISEIDISNIDELEKLKNSFKTIC